MIASRQFPIKRAIELLQQNPHTNQDDIDEAIQILEDFSVEEIVHELREENDINDVLYYAKKFATE